MKHILRISLLLMLIASEARADVVVIVRREAEALGKYVRICDIARVEGPKEQAAEVGATVLGPTPAKGDVMEISRWDIENRLYEMGVAAPVSFSGNTTVKVFGNGARRRGYEEPGGPDLRELDPVFDIRPGSATNGGQGGPGLGGGFSGRPAGGFEPAGGAGAPERSGTPLDSMPPEARDRVAKAIAHYLAGRYARPDVEVESTLLSATAPIPYDAHEIIVAEALSGKVPGPATLRLKVRDAADAEARQVTVTADSAVFAPAPVAARRLLKGEVLSRRDVQVRRVRMESGRAYFPPNPDAVEGRELKSTLEAGAPLLATETAASEAVRRGAQVQTDTAGSGWRVQGYATALEGGMIGDLIQVQDSGTKQKYPARVVGRNRVEVLGSRTL